MEFAEKLSCEKVFLAQKLKNIFSQLSDDILYVTVLNPKHKDDLDLCIRHLLECCPDTRHPMDVASTKDPTFDCSERCTEDMRNQTFSMGAMCVETAGCGERSWLVFDEFTIKDDSQALRIVLFGKTGSGKSSACNTILGKTAFKTLLSSSSVTKKCQEARGTRFGKEILLVDTPGVFDTITPNKQVLQEIAKCISLCLPGPHVFLLILQTGRFTPEENDTVEHFAKMFGEDVFDHMILVFTGRDALEKRQQSFEEFLQTIPPPLKVIMKKCNKRCIAIDNTANNKSRDTDARDLMNVINALVKDRNGKHYTNEIFKTAEKKCLERENEIRREKDQEKKKEKEELIKQLTKEFQMHFDRLRAEKSSLQQKIRDSTTEKEILEEKLHDSSLKDEELTAMKEKIKTVETEAEQYKEQAEDVTHQQQECSQNRDQCITQQSEALDRKYAIIVNFSIAIARPGEIFTLIKGAAEWSMRQLYSSMCLE